MKRITAFAAFALIVGIGVDPLCVCLAVDPENAGNRLQGANKVEVRLSEYHLAIPSELPAGKTAFVVTNDGTEKHSFVVEGSGVEEKFPQELRPGETRTLKSELKPGKYRVYCPVANHHKKGMAKDLSVK